MATRHERQRALIVCEGSKTEPSYLRALSSYLGLTTAEVEVCGECGSAPTSVVKFGKEKLDADSDFEFVFFVFDRDSYYLNGVYDKAISQITALQNQTEFKEKVVAAITSVPCFEIWFLLHFEQHERPCDATGRRSPCDNLISRLKAKPGFANYAKGGADYFTLLLDRLPEAKQNAARILSASDHRGDQKHHGNPTTLMHELVCHLEFIAAS